MSGYHGYGAGSGGYPQQPQYQQNYYQQPTYNGYQQGQHPPPQPGYGYPQQPPHQQPQYGYSVCWVSTVHLDFLPRPTRR
jgi:hypothetical protein